MLKTHFDKLSIPAPIVAIKIEVKKFDAFFAKSNSLLKDNASGLAPYSDISLVQFIEQLQARLGNNYVKSISNATQHCPEHANLQIGYKEKPNQENKITVPAEVSANPRPLWLLQEPKQLNINKGRLFYRKPISIVSGPERIETHWWSGIDVCRDYYTARENQGSRLWIYREKTGERHWYLHGFFA